MKVAGGNTRTHNPFGEDYRASCLRENLTSSSYGEGLETGRESAQEPRQSFTRQKFFGWWKRHLRVYHLIARSEYGLMVQILAGLVTYLLLAIYCHQKHNEKVSIQRVRELRTKIQNEARNFPACPVHVDRENDLTASNIKDQREYSYAKT